VLWVAYTTHSTLNFAYSKFEVQSDVMLLQSKTLLQDSRLFIIHCTLWGVFTKR
jgi:hypothetical protein